jgi:deferrochelatase/peroxidase EfeB
MSEVSRRRMLGASGAGLLAGAAVGAGIDRVATAGERAGAARPGDVPFYGTHQASIATPVQARLHFAAFDVVTEDRPDLVQMLKDWTTAAAAMTAGLPVGEGAIGGPVVAPPHDTGEALGLPASRLTLTIGFGPSLFAKEHLGIGARRPPALADLPRFPGDKLDPACSGGDIAVQACADDPQVAVHAIRMWAAAGDGAGWMAGGSYLVVRRIRMHIETWDRTSLQEQQDIIGRDKGEGAPVGGRKERDKVVPGRMLPDAHVRLAHPDTNHGARIL